MGYFSNGTEGMMFEERWCHRCVHYGPEEGPGCPVWFAHLLYAYEECDSGTNAENILNMLIKQKDVPRDDPRHPFYNECQMFVESQPDAE